MILSEQEQLRRDKLQQMRSIGIEPYPAAQYHLTHYATDILENFDKQPDNYKQVRLAGRLMSMRVQGSASFAEIQDTTGRIQIYVRRDDICPDEDKTLYNTVFKKLLDLGDFIGVEGYVFRTQVGEISIHVERLVILAKALRPLPIVKTDSEGNVHDAVTDAEFRYRQRYADLVVNPQVRETFVKRTKIYSTLRDFFNSKGYLEVETPILQSIPGGASARPFITHHNALDMPLYLRIANELYLKRLIVGGFEGVYEFAKDFRNEGMDRTHNPEFTIMEIYVAYKDYLWMMDFTEEMIEKVALALHGKTTVTVGKNEINFQRPFARLSMRDAILKYSNNEIDIAGKTENELRAFCQQKGIETAPSMGKGKLIDELFGELCEANLIQPTFITDYPIEMSPLCKRHRENPELTERFELIVNGKELCNAYSELNDPIDQYERFQEQLKLSAKGDDEAMFIDLDFIRALEYGMPPTSGMGIGMDRLTMLMTNEASIQDVLFFPQMRPEKRTEMAETADYVAIGVREELVPILQKMGFLTIEALKQASAGKLLNDIGGMRKKMKLDSVKPATKEEIEAWLQ
ncbi:MAG: lysine--tRNA ligase [Bacteroidetes bacterium]|nr:MAG: lysine--tRNA ligase [Bacteroidota bacterium]